MTEKQKIGAFLKAEVVLRALIFYDILDVVAAIIKFSLDRMRNTVFVLPHGVDFRDICNTDQNALTI